MYPTISPYRDSGDMIVSASSLGIAHPPGYPLYVLLGKIFTTIIPFGNIAYRINLMSAFFGALSCGVLYLLIKKLNEEYFKDKNLPVVCISLFAVFLFCFCSSMWSLSIVSEMYSLNTFFAVLIIYLVVKQNWLLAVFLFGLGLGNHHTLVLLIPGIVYLLILKLKEWNDKKPTNRFPFISLLIVLIAGLSIYLFLIVRSAQNPVTNWGTPSESIRNFTRVLTRADYGSIRLHPERSPVEQNLTTMLENLIQFLVVSVRQFSYWILPVLILGIYFSIKKKSFLALFLFWFFSGPVFFIISNLSLKDKTSLPIFEPYLIIPLIIFTIWINFGFIAFFNIFKFVNEKIVFFLIITCIFILTTFKISMLNKRYEFIAYDYSKNLMRTLPYNSILFNPDDTTTFTLKYQQECLAKRKDIKLAVFYKTLWGYEQLRKKYPEILPNYEIKSGVELENVLLSYSYDRFPFYTDSIIKVPAKGKFLPKGLLYGNNDFSNSEQMFDFYVEPRFSGEVRFFTQQILSYYAAGYNNLGLVFNEKKIYNKSILFFEKAIVFDPSLSQAYNNLGVVYWAKNDYKKAAEYFKVSLKYAPEDKGVRRNLNLAEEKIK